MTAQHSTWHPGEWGVGVVGLTPDDQVFRVEVRRQAADATWQQQRDLARELKSKYIGQRWTEVIWVTPDGRLFFLEPHDEKALNAVGAAAAQQLPHTSFDQSALLDEAVEQRRRSGRHEPEPIDDLPIYW